MKNKKLLLALIIITACAAIFGFIGLKHYGLKNNVQIENYVEYKGNKYVLNDDISTVLLFGVDKDANYLKENEDVFVVRNQEQADFILLMAINNKTNEAKAIKINRDSMFKTSSITNNYKDEYTQLALAHTYGSGGSDSAVNLMDAVSSIFGDYLRINNYIKVPYDIVKTTNKLVDGITLEVIQDMESEDSRLIKGNVVTLDGDLATIYVKARKNLEDDSNESRMDRQTQYIKEFIKKYQELDSISLDNATDITSMIYSNLSVSRIQQIIENVKPDDIQFYDLEGYDSKGSEFIEFNVDTDFATDLLFDTFFHQLS